MGHMILIAEEIVKLFEHYQEEIYLVIEPHIPQPAWDRYVTKTLRETRERDLSPLGGGVANHLHDTSSVTSALSDEDDEFPMNAVRALRAVEANSKNGLLPGAEDGQLAGGLFDAESKRATDAEIADASSHDQFSRYLANAIAGDRPDKFGSSDEEDEDDDETGWVGSSGDPRDRDFALGELERPPKQFGFDDRFEMAGKQVFRSSTEDSDDEGEWGGAFATSEPASKAPSSATTKGNELFSDDFKPTVASSSAYAVAAAVAGFGSSFVDSFTDSFASSPSVPSGDDDEDDFGDFEDASVPSITLPSMDDALDDFDFGEEGRRVESNAAAGNSNLDAPNSATIAPTFCAPRPGALLRRDTVEDGGSYP
ncbi:BZ3500_MvSof-1268-A1-R1_Chr4-2g06898 [Microbotryum saponariae]|uniref:BZ3500_MvSof-1268-A1-R1_Chr4-2g06898 protein n=1 Tax=Microbotryum saponariae TaxID=289078 RepID=A0A2X0M3K6_9BASI|nr:BZ3500_MvSof-1268-A1-R1_Chr4-2g06898 [Microbotryum saponariae]SDA06563.1 BZ3501_MvSof-1269-A2-R1_Chr4-2g06609 [Microbotryum saponariae]